MPDLAYNPRVPCLYCAAFLAILLADSNYMTVERVNIRCCTLSGDSSQRQQVPLRFFARATGTSPANVQSSACSTMATP